MKYLRQDTREPGGGDDPHQPSVKRILKNQRAGDAGGVLDGTDVCRGPPVKQQAAQHETDNDRIEIERETFAGPLHNKCEDAEEDQREIENPRIVEPGAQGVCTLLGVDLLVLFAEAVRVGHDGALFRRLEIPKDDGQDDQQHQARDQVEARKDSFRQGNAAAGDLLDDVEHRSVRGLGERDRTGQAFRGDNEPGIGGGDQPAEIEPDPLGHLACQEG